MSLYSPESPECALGWNLGQVCVSGGQRGGTAPGWGLLTTTSILLVPWPPQNAGAPQGTDPALNAAPWYPRPQAPLGLALLSPWPPLPRYARQLLSRYFPDVETSSSFPRGGRPFFLCSRQKRPDRSSSVRPRGRPGPTVVGLRRHSAKGPGGDGLEEPSKAPALP